MTTRNLSTYAARRWLVSRFAWLLALALVLWAWHRPAHGAEPEPVFVDDGAVAAVLDRLPALDGADARSVTVDNLTIALVIDSGRDFGVRPGILAGDAVSLALEAGGFVVGAVQRVEGKGRRRRVAVVGTFRGFYDGTCLELWGYLRGRACS